MTTHYLLAAEHELRIEVSSAHAPGALLRLASGSAEVAGVELAEGRAYALAPGRQLAVFTWYGAELVVSSAALSLVPAHGASSSSSTTSSSSSSSASAAAFASVYVSGDSQVPVYANLHQRLEARRDEARLAGAAAAAAGGARHFQFERVGFFVLDPDTRAAAGALVFNSVVGLKERTEMKKARGGDA